MTGPSNSPRPPDEGTSFSVEPRPQSSSTRSEYNEREGIELHEIQTHEDDEAGLSSASISSGEYRVTTRTRSRASQHRTDGREAKGIWGSFRRFWTSHVVLTVPQKSNRDHFALERTFLAYIRTSVMLAMQGVLIAQLFRLQRLPLTTGPKLGFYEVGIPLATSCHGLAAVVSFIGAYRFWKQQHAVSQGRVYTGGWELNIVGLLVALLIIAIFVLSAFITAELQ